MITQWQTQPLPATTQPPSGCTCVRPALNPAPAGYGTAAARMDVSASGSEPSPCRLGNSRRPDGHVCARHGTQPLPAIKQPPSGQTCEHLAEHTAPAGYAPAPPAGASTQPLQTTHLTEPKSAHPATPASTSPARKLDHNPRHPDTADTTTASHPLLPPHVVLQSLSSSFRP